MNREELIPRLKKLMVECLHLEEMDLADLGEDESLFGGTLDLDSIEALELVLGLEKEFGIKIATSEESKKALQSLGALADTILAQSE
jgi:acyl carrier protein